MERAIKINEWPREDRPREKLLSKGADNLTDTELLALILGTGHGRSGQNVLDLSRTILTRFGSFAELGAAGTAELIQIPGLGQAKAVQIQAAMELARRLSRVKSRSGNIIKTSRDIFEEYEPRMGHLRQEVFVAVLLDARNRRIKDITISKGSLTETVVHPREVFLHVIRESAAGMLLIHNHPSGDPTPSPADMEITRRIQSCAIMLGVRLVDHIILGSDGYTSFVDRGLLVSVKAG